jgi:hypothetical protein
MKITLTHLKKGWNSTRLKKIKEIGFVIGSDKFLNQPYHVLALYCIDAIWSDDHDGSVEKRNNARKGTLGEFFKHVFISEICDVAVEEYATVCKLLKVKTIFLLGDKEFTKKSRKLLSSIPEISIEEINETNTLKRKFNKQILKI